MLRLPILRLRILLRLRPYCGCAYGSGCCGYCGCAYGSGCCRTARLPILRLHLRVRLLNKLRLLRVRLLNVTLRREPILLRSKARLRREWSRGDHLLARMRSHRLRERVKQRTGCRHCRARVLETGGKGFARRDRHITRIGGRHLAHHFRVWAPLTGPFCTRRGRPLQTVVS